MKKFRDLIEADAKDYKGDGESQKDYDTAASDEEKFKQLHFTHNADLAKMGREHPVAPDYVFTGERPGGTKGDEPVAITIFLHLKILSIPLLSLTPTF